jgi:transcription termination factor NusA
MTSISGVSGIGPHLAAALAAKGISTAEHLAASSPETLCDIPGVGARRAASLVAAARRAFENTPNKPSKMPKAAARTVPRKAPVKIRPVSDPDKVETSPAPEKATIKVAKHSKKSAAKKSAAKKAAAKAMKALKKVAAELKAKQKAVTNKAAKKKAKKKAKATKDKKAGKSKKK